MVCRIKTSKLLCMIIDNEVEVESSKINYYLKELVKAGYIKVNGTTMKLTKKGKDYATRRECNENNIK